MPPRSAASRRAARAHADALLGGLLFLLTTGAGVARAEDYRSETVERAQRHEVTATSASTHLSTEDAQTGTVDTATILQREPDLRIRRTGGLNGPAFVSIRGSEPDAVRFSIDGTPLHGAASTVLDVNTLLPEMLERIDIYRTTAPIALGPPAPGGIIDLRLRDTSQQQLMVSLGLGSWWTRKAAFAMTLPLEDGHLRVAATLRGSQGSFRFHNTNGTDTNPHDDVPNQRRRNNDFNQGALLFLRDQQIGGMKLRLLSLTDIHESGASGLDVAQSREARTSRIQQLIGLEGRHRLGDRQRSDLTWVVSMRAHRSTFQDLQGEIGLGRQDRSDEQLFGFLALRSSTWMEHGLSLHLVADAQLEHNRPVDRISPVLVRTAARLLPSVGGELRWHTEDRRLALSAGLRASLYLQRNDARPVPAAPEERVVTPLLAPQFGVVWRALTTDAWTLDTFGYASRTHRQPGFDELYGDNGGSIGNPELLPERQTGLEVGGKLGWVHGEHQLGLRLSLWRHWRQDAIEYIALATGVRKPFNVPGAHAAGQELALDYHSRWSSLTLSMTHMATASQSEDPMVHRRELPWRSPWSATADLRIRPTDCLELASTFRYDAPFYADLRNRRQYPERIELDLGARWQPRFVDGVTVSVELFNLLNRRTTTIPSRNGGVDTEAIRPVADYHGYPRPGRGFFVTLSYRSGRS